MDTQVGLAMWVVEVRLGGYCWSLDGQVGGLVRSGWILMYNKLVWMQHLTWPLQVKTTEEDVQDTKTTEAPSDSAR